MVALNACIVPDSGVILVKALVVLIYSVAQVKTSVSIGCCVLLKEFMAHLHSIKTPVTQSVMANVKIVLVKELSYIVFRISLKVFVVEYVIVVPPRYLVFGRK